MRISDLSSDVCSSDLLASRAPSSGARTHITSGSLNASVSSSAEPIGMQLQNTFLSPCTLSTRAPGGQSFCWRRVASGHGAIPRREDRLHTPADNRNTVVEGKGVSVRVGTGGGRGNKKKN